MPSNEDYLEQLLKGLSDGEESAEGGADYSDRPGELNFEEILSAYYSDDVEGNALEPEAAEEVITEEVVPEAVTIEPDVSDTYSEEIVVEAIPDVAIPELEATEAVTIEPDVSDTYSEEIVVEAIPDVAFPEAEAAEEISEEAVPREVSTEDNVIETYSEELIVDTFLENAVENELPQEEGSGTISMEKLLEETAEESHGNVDSNPVPEAVPEEEAIDTTLLNTEIPFDMSEIDELLKFSEEDEAEDEDSGMSEEQIEQVLQANRMEEPKPGDDAVSQGEEDLLSLLEDAGEENGDLQDIHDMLQRSDNNEAVDEDMIAKMQELPDMAEEDDGSELASDAGDTAEGELTEREKKALERKKLKEEKAAAKKAAKEAKKAEKLAKKDAKAKKGEMDAGLEDSGTDVLETTDAESDASGVTDVGMTDAGTETEKSEDDAMLDEFFGSELFADMAASDGNEGGEETAAEAEETLEEAEKFDESPDSKPKKNLFARILDFLTEEDEDEESSERGTEDIPLSDENKQVLDEMDQEEPGGKGKKKKKKDKKEKKKGKQAAVAEGDDEEDGEGKQEKKPKKAKKEKPPKEETPVDPRHRITFKKILPVMLIGVSLLLAIMLLVNLGGDFTVKRQARNAFYAEDYETCYQELYGRKLSESEQVMFGKSESILCIRLWMREYELFADEGAEVEALDVLIQSVNDYSDLYAYASQWNAAGEVGEVYSQMLNILQDKYGLTEAQALEIAAEPDDVEYTKLVTAAAQGNGYRSSTDTQKPIELPDMLPEEGQFPENNGG